MSRQDIPLYLAGAAAVAALISIAAFQILIGLALVAMLATRTKFRWPPIAVPMLVWLGLTLVSLIGNGHLPDGWPQIRKFYIYLLLFLVGSTFRTARQLWWLVSGWALAATLSSAWGLQQLASKYLAAKSAGAPFYEAYLGARITGFADHWMTFSGQMMLALLAVGAAALLGRRRRETPWLVLSGVVVLSAIILAYTRSMWAGTAVGGLYLIWFWRRWMVLMVPVLLGILLIVNPFDIRERVVSIVQPREELDSNQHRAWLRRTGVRMIQAHPLFGLGPGQPKEQFLDYYPAEAPHPVPHVWYTGHLHNLYLQFAAERGIPALLAFLWVLGQPLYDFLRGLRRLPENAEQRWILHAGVAAILAIVVSGYAEVNLGDSEVLGVFMAVLGAGYAALESAPTSGNPATDTAPDLV